MICEAGGGVAPTVLPTVEVVIDEAPMRAALIDYSERVLGLSIVISLVTAALVYLSLQWLMIWPMRRLTEAMVAFLAVASLGGVWSLCAPYMGTNAVLDRFQQIAPKMLIACDGVRYGGREDSGLSERFFVATPQGWKIYDIVVEGVSLVLTYRSEFDAVVKQEGVDGLIKRLAAKNSGSSGVGGTSRPAAK